MRMMKVIDKDMTMVGLEKDILVLILWLQQVLVLLQRVVKIMVIISIKIAQMQVQALVLRQVVTVIATIKR